MNIMQSKVAKKVMVNDEVQHTVDPDQFFRGSTSLHEREEYLEALHTLKEDKFNRLLEKGERILFFGILLLAADKVVQETQIVRELAAKKADMGFASDLVESKIKRRKEMKKNKASVARLDAANRDIQNAVQIKSKVKSTEYIFKLLAHGSVESIFGPVFTRLVRGMKGIDQA